MEQLWVFTADKTKHIKEVMTAFKYIFCTSAFYLILFLALLGALKCFAILFPALENFFFSTGDVRSSFPVLPLLFSRRAASRGVLPGVLEVKHIAVLSSHALSNLQAWREKSGYWLKPSAIATGFSSFQRDSAIGISEGTAASSLTIRC